MSTVPRCCNFTGSGQCANVNDLPRVAAGSKTYPRPVDCMFSALITTPLRHTMSRCAADIIANATCTSQHLCHSLTPLANTHTHNSLTHSDTHSHHWPILTLITHSLRHSLTPLANTHTHNSLTQTLTHTTGQYSHS